MNGIIGLIVILLSVYCIVPQKYAPSNILDYLCIFCSMLTVVFSRNMFLNFGHDHLLWSVYISDL